LFEQDGAPDSIRHEERNTLKVTHTNRRLKEADKGRVSKENQALTSKYFMCTFLRVRFAKRKTQNSAICETEIAQVW
jgi:hypothetical protein